MVTVHGDPDSGADIVQTLPVQQTYETNMHIKIHYSRGFIQRGGGGAKTQHEGRETRGREG